MKGAAVLLMVALLSGCAHQDQWTKRDTALQLTLTAVVISDAITTANIYETPGIREVGPVSRHVLGRQPKPSDVYLWHGTLIASNWLIARALPARWRRYWQLFGIASHGNATYQNCQLDLC